MIFKTKTSRVVYIFVSVLFWTILLAIIAPHIHAQTKPLTDADFPLPTMIVETAVTWTDNELLAYQEGIRDGFNWATGTIYDEGYTEYAMYINQQLSAFWYWYTKPYGARSQVGFLHEMYSRSPELIGQMSLIRFLLSTRISIRAYANTQEEAAK